jgi:feruloyl esterase
MPVAEWNNKFLAVGNGGWAGSISYPAMAEALMHGYATSSTDTGHTGSGASFALGHPEKIVDFGYRAVHEMTIAAKPIVAAVYGNGPKHSYWQGCSTGGRQGLVEAQRYPADYDGIIAGGPANYWTHLNAANLWVSQAVHKEEGSYIPPVKYRLIHDAVVNMCDGRDGVKDGLLENPTECRFDPQLLECKDGDATQCLTTFQVEAAQKIYTPVTNPRTKEQIFPGLEPGSELGWGAQAGPEPTFGLNLFKFIVFKDPGWDYRRLNFDDDISLADKIDNGTMNAINANLKVFFERGGKLLMYHGWADQIVAPRNSINYYERVNEAMGGVAKTTDSMRLFMAPGMNHCGGGEGPNTFDMVSALERWVEQGTVSDQIIASHNVDGKIDRTRPLCPYPRVAQYKGTGSIDDAANFACRMP